MIKDAQYLLRDILCTWPDRTAEEPITIPVPGLIALRTAGPLSPKIIERDGPKFKGNVFFSISDGFFAAFMNSPRDEWEDGEIRRIRWDNLLDDFVESYRREYPGALIPGVYPGLFDEKDPNVPGHVWLEDPHTTPEYVVNVDLVELALLLFPAWGN